MYILNIYIHTMDEIKKILYIGSGCHLDIVSHFPNVSEFILIDTQPRSEHDSIEFNPDFYRHLFVNSLLSAGIKHNIILTNICELDDKYYHLEHKMPFLNPTLLTFTNTKTTQTIKYYISTNIRYNMNEILINDIQQSDALIVSGHYPDIILYDYLDKKKPIQFIGYSKTCFSLDIDEMKDTIYYKLHNNSYFDKYYLVDYDSGEITKYKTFMQLAR
jgi:hypothetical protein